MRVVAWQAESGRNDLPWQNTRDPYRVWLSEIMLQQTQVITVLSYFSRFLTQFPNVSSLAAASLDDVLALWSGLGYYSRARNLHQCAIDIETIHGGMFPQSTEGLESLPGIGRSTAAAIASLCYGDRVAILDGNVKRVLTRVLGFSDDLARAASERRLWDEATSLLPRDDLYNAMPRYTQGVMDLGATVCVTKNPRCDVCPLASLCIAKETGEPEKYPVKTRKIKRSAQSIWLLVARQFDGRVLLNKRPTPGVWAGLYCVPLYEDRAALEADVARDLRGELTEIPVFTHVLTHKDLYLHPVILAAPNWLGDFADGSWISAEKWPLLGLPAPIRKLLTAI
jgi:A/G-specific adenine glycosylase